MKRIATVVVFATLFVLGIASKARAWEEKECSNATLKGSFGYTSTGALLPAYAGPDAGPFAEVGRQTFDGKGHADATATVSANGDITQVTVEGTYSVKPDCTGSMTLNVSPFEATVDLAFVIDQDGEEIRAIVTDANVIESRVYRKQFREPCEEHSSLMLGTRPLFPGVPAACPVQLSRIFQWDRRGRIWLPRRSLLTVKITEGAVWVDLTAGWATSSRLIRSQVEPGGSGSVSMLRRFPSGSRANRKLRI